MMADPIAHILTTLKYIERAAEKMHSNRVQCSKLAAHSRDVLSVIKHEFEAHRLQGDLADRLRTLNRALSDLCSLLQDLANQPMLKRFLWRDMIATKINAANKSIESAVQTFHLGAQIDLRRLQDENEAARRTDTEELQRTLDKLMHNEDQILDFLGVQRAQMQEAMMSVHKHIHKLTKTIERRFLETGLGAMQRRSGPLSLQPDRFVITNLDITVYEHKKLGEGGFSTVWLADYLGTTVAVKRMVPGVPDYIMQQEINVWKDLRHPHILLFIGACSIANPPFIISEYKRNGDAATFLRKNPGSDRVKIMLEASLGLVYLHSKGVIHCDLKASNILIDENNCACLADFGLSEIKLHTTILAKSHNSVQLAGSVQWMAPERLSGEKPTKWSDIWSFGMTMWELYTGRPPYGDIPIPYLQNAIREGRRPPDPRIGNPALSEYDLDDGLWDLMNECWQELPDRRPSTYTLRSTLDHHVMQRGSTRIASPPSGHSSRPDDDDLFRFEDLNIGNVLGGPQALAPSTSLYRQHSESRPRSVALPSSGKPMKERKGMIGSIRKAFRGAKESPAADTSSPLQSLIDATTPVPFNIQDLRPNPFSSSLLGLPLDLSLRILLLHVPYTDDSRHAVSLFAKAWAARYRTVMEEDQVRRVAFDLIMTNIECFDKRATPTTLTTFMSKMKGEGLDDVTAEYLYHNITYAPFLYRQDLEEIQRRLTLSHTPVIVSGGKIVASGFKLGKTTDIYAALIQNRLGPFRVQTHSNLMEPDGAYFRTLGSSLTVQDSRNSCIAACPVLVKKAVKPTQTEWLVPLTAAGMAYQPVKEAKVHSRRDDTMTIRLISVGILERKEVPIQDNSGITASSWESWGVALTPTSLYFFRNTGWLRTFKARADAEAEAWANTSAGTNRPRRVEDFNPDEELPLHGVIAVYDQADTGIEPIFHLVTPRGPRYSFRSVSSSAVAELDGWLENVNYAAAHKTLDLPMHFTIPDIPTARSPPSASWPEVAHTPNSPASYFGSSSSLSTSPRSRAGNRDDTHLHRPIPLAAPSSRNGGMVPPGSSPASRLSVETPVTPISDGSASSFARRSELLQQCIPRLGKTISDVHLHLDPALRMARTWAMLVPFESPTRAKIQKAEIELSKKIRKMRLDLAKWEAYLDIARVDLGAEQEEWESEFEDLRAADNGAHKRAGVYPLSITIGTTVALSSYFLLLGSLVKPLWLFLEIVVKR